jgi:hypothetical protein
MWHETPNYLNQLIRKGYELYPTLKYKDKVEELLKNSGLLISDGPLS